MKATIIVPRKEADYIKKLLTVEPTTEKDCFGEDETIVYTGYFDNGYSVDIKCCGVQYEEGNDNTAWSEAVWFDDKGREVACSEPCDDFLGEWEYYDFENDKMYTVEVITETN